METNSGNFSFLAKGLYRVGLTEARFREISSSQQFLDSDLKGSFLEASVPEHAVHLEDTLVSRFLVSIQDFEEFVTSSGYRTEAERDGWAWTWTNGWKKAADIAWRSPTGTELDDLCRDNKNTFPVMQVSYNDAACYCTWLGEKWGKEVYVPTEYDWEVFSRDKKSTSVQETAWLAGKEQTLDSYLMAIEKIVQETPGSSPVGMIWEWTGSWYDAFPGGPQNGEFGRVYRVLKGGSLFSNQIQHHDWYRFRRCPTARSPFYGFRIAVRP